jgi:hypothetical protein
MDYSPILHKLNAGYELPQKIAAFYFAQITAPMKQVVHRLMRTQFEQQVDVRCVFKEVLEPHDVGVRETHLNGNFLFQLFLSVLGLKCFF